MAKISGEEIGRLIEEGSMHSCAKRSRSSCAKLIAAADLPSKFGNFQVFAFETGDGKEHVAFTCGNVLNNENVPVRIHSECLTGDAIGSLRCDCGPQLQASLRQIAKRRRGIVVYLRQEGRGIGLVNKIRAYRLQDSGLDTVEANKVLGFRPDERTYGIAAHMLNAFHVKSIKLISNNPSKFNELRKHGIRIIGRIPLTIKPNKYNIKYLKTKKSKLGQLLDNVA